MQLFRDDMTYNLSMNQTEKASISVEAILKLQRTDLWDFLPSPAFVDTFTQ